MAVQDEKMPLVDLSFSYRCTTSAYLHFQKSQTVPCPSFDTRLTKNTDYAVSWPTSLYFFPKCTPSTSCNSTRKRNPGLPYRQRLRLERQTPWMSN